jgi:hypothetical protein
VNGSKQPACHVLKFSKKYSVQQHLANKCGRSSTYLFSRNVFALDTFFPIADAFQEKYDPEGSTYKKHIDYIKTLQYKNLLTSSG